MTLLFNKNWKLNDFQKRKIRKIFSSDMRDYEDFFGVIERRARSIQAPAKLKDSDLEKIEKISKKTAEISELIKSLDSESKHMIDLAMESNIERLLIINDQISKEGNKTKFFELVKYYPSAHSSFAQTSVREIPPTLNERFRRYDFEIEDMGNFFEEHDEEVKDITCQFMSFHEIIVEDKNDERKIKKYKVHRDKDYIWSLIKNADGQRTFIDSEASMERLNQMLNYHFESIRVCRRLIILRELANEQKSNVFPRSPRASSSHGFDLRA